MFCNNYLFSNYVHAACLKIVWGRITYQINKLGDKEKQAALKLKFKRLTDEKF